jgi:hypothetical protein
MFGSGKGGGGNAPAQKPVAAHRARVQNSVEGQILPILCGTRRLKGMLFGYWDFTPIAHTETTQVGGKGGGTEARTLRTRPTPIRRPCFVGCVSAPKTSPSTSSGEVWGTQGKSGTQTATETFVLAGATQVVAHAGTEFTSGPRRQPLNRGGPRLRRLRRPGRSGEPDFDDWVPLTKTTGAPGASQYSVNSTGTYTFNAVNIGKTVRISYSYNLPAADTTPTDPPVLKNFTIFKGTARRRRGPTSSPAIAADAMHFAGVALAANDKEDLGSSGTLENDTFEAISTSVSVAATWMPRSTPSSQSSPPTRTSAADCPRRCSTT